MPRLATLLVLLACIAACLPADAGAAPSIMKSCGEIAFTPGTTLSASNYGVGEIAATRVGCPVARSVARAVKNQGGLSYATHGFRCRGTAKGSGPGPRKDWRCTRTRAIKVGKRTRREQQIVTFFSIGV